MAGVVEVRAQERQMFGLERRLELRQLLEHLEDPQDLDVRAAGIDRVGEDSFDAQMRRLSDGGRRAEVERVAENVRGYLRRLERLPVQATVASHARAFAELIEALEFLRSVEAGRRHRPDFGDALANVLVEVGLDKLAGNTTAYINVPGNLLGSEAIKLLPADRVVLEVLEDISWTPEVERHLLNLKSDGYKLALDDYTFEDRHQPFLRLVDIVKVDVMNMSRSDLKEGMSEISRWGQRYLAEKVESPEDYLACQELGFDLFQGYFFFHHLGMDRNLREQFRGHPGFERTALFCERYDGPAFNPQTETLPLKGREVNVIFSHIRPLPDAGYDERRYVSVWGPIDRGTDGRLELIPEESQSWDESKVPFFQYSEVSVPQAHRYLDALSGRLGRRVRPRLAFFWLALRTTRAPFLTATVIPVVLGVAAAALRGRWSFWLAVLTLVGAACIHLALNVANDVFDTMSGADPANTRPTQFSGGSRVIHYGLVSLRGAATVSAGFYLAGIAIGLLSGLTGTGGGIFLSPVLILMHWAGTRETAGISAAFILCNSISGLTGNLVSVGHLPTYILLWMAAAGIGGLVGASLGSKRFDPVLLRRLLAIVLVIAGIKLIFFS